MNRVVLSELRAPWMTIQLNRPKQLNAVDKNVAQCGIQSLVENVRKVSETSRFDLFQNSSETLLSQAKILLASGTGRAVAAGGDVNSMVNSIKNGRPQDSEDYLRAEYQFYYLMNTLPIPSFTLMPQICMGGGLGFCHSTTIRIASEKTRLGKG